MLKSSSIFMNVKIIKITYFFIFYLEIPAHDKPGYNIAQHFTKSSEFIDRHRKYTSVLVHCYAGISRSAALCIAYIMKKYNW